METVKITAKPRTDSGKGTCRRLRAAGEIPAVAYGKNLPSQSLSVSPKALVEVLQSSRGRNTVVELAVEGGKSLKALVCDYQYHPVTRQLLHADFLEVSETEPVDVDVPFRVTGRAKGVVLGGTLRQVFRKLPVRCLAKDIPESLVHDISELGLDEHVVIGDLAAPEGVTFRLAPTRTVVAIVGEKRRGEAEAGEEATEGAPAKKP